MLATKSKDDGSIYPQVVVAIIRDKKGHLLVSQRSLKSKAPGKWQIPGGKVEPGENHDKALKREVKEETDMNVELISELIFRFMDKENKFDVYFYQVKACGEPKVKEPEKLNSEWVYLPIDELRKKDMVPALSEFIKKVNKI